MVAQATSVHGLVEEKAAKVINLAEANIFSIFHDEKTAQENPIRVPSCVQKQKSHDRASSWRWKPCHGEVAQSFPSAEL